MAPILSTNNIIQDYFADDVHHDMVRDTASKSKSTPPPLSPLPKKINTPTTTSRSKPKLLRAHALPLLFAAASANKIQTKVVGRELSAATQESYTCQKVKVTGYACENGYGSAPEHQSYGLNGYYHYKGTTANGKPWYESEVGQRHHIFYDDNCGGSPANEPWRANWFFGCEAPSTTADKNLQEGGEYPGSGSCCNSLNGAAWSEGLPFGTNRFWGWCGSGGDSGMKEITIACADGEEEEEPATAHPVAAPTPKPTISEDVGSCPVVEVTGYACANGYGNQPDHQSYGVNGLYTYDGTTKDGNPVYKGATHNSDGPHYLYKDHGCGGANHEWLFGCSDPDREATSNLQHGEAGDCCNTMRSDATPTAAELQFPVGESTFGAWCRNPQDSMDMQITITCVEQSVDYAKHAGKCADEHHREVDDDTYECNGIQDCDADAECRGYEELYDEQPPFAVQKSFCKKSPAVVGGTYGNADGDAHSICFVKNGFEAPAAPSYAPTSVATYPPTTMEENEKPEPPLGIELEVQQLFGEKVMVVKLANGRAWADEHGNEPEAFQFFGVEFSVDGGDFLDTDRHDELSCVNSLGGARRGHPYADDHFCLVTAHDDDFQCGTIQARAYLVSTGGRSDYVLSSTVEVPCATPPTRRFLRGTSLGL